jgi:hypothetical protein
VVNTRQGYVEAFLKPASFDNGLPEALFNQFFEVILNGVKGRLFGHPGKPYSSPQFAEYNMKRFRVGINLARGQAAQLNSGQQAWTSRTLAAYLVGGSYTPDFATDTTVASLPVGSLLAGPTNLTTLTAAGGIAGAAVLDFGSITTTAAVEGVLIVDHTSVTGTLAPLVLYLNQGVGFGQIVEGVDCKIIWDTRGIWSP